MLSLTQFLQTDRSDGAGWGAARYAPGAAEVAVGQSPGYLVEHLGSLLLDWKRGDVGWELQAPASVLLPRDLLVIAASVPALGPDIAMPPTGTPAPTLVAVPTAPPALPAP